MMVNPDGYNKTLNHRKILRKAQKIKNLLKIKRILQPKYKLSGGPVFKISLPGLGWGDSRLCHPSLMPLVKSAYGASPTMNG